MNAELYSFSCGSGCSSHSYIVGCALPVVFPSLIEGQTYSCVTAYFYRPFDWTLLRSKSRVGLWLPFCVKWQDFVSHVSGRGIAAWSRVSGKLASPLRFPLQLCNDSLWRHSLKWASVSVPTLSLPEGSMVCWPRLTPATVNWRVAPGEFQGTVISIASDREWGPWETLPQYSCRYTGMGRACEGM